jgi:hypothetical protein
VSKVKRLLNSWARFIEVPWRDDAAAPQRVVFCVYQETDELRLRAHIDEFELATTNAGHNWALFDLTNTFANWMSEQKYAQRYFQQPNLLPSILPGYATYISQKFKEFLDEHRAGENHVVALKGVGSLFGFVKVKGVVDQLAPLVPGRLLVFFPGSYEDNNYRLLDGYDGWNYLAVPITADKDVL